MSASSSKPRVPAIVERFVKRLYVTYNAVRLYPPTSSIPKTNAAEALAVLRGALRQLPSVELAVSKDGFSHNGLAVFPDSPVFAAFAREFYNRSVAEIRFHSGVSDAELVSCLVLLDAPPASLLSSGGFEARLWDAQVDNITVKESSTRIVDSTVGPPGEKTEVAGERWPPGVDRIEEILAGAFGGRPRDQRLLVRIIAEPELLQTYLRDCTEGRGSVPGDAWVASRIGTFAHAVASEIPGDDREAMYRSLGEALAGLDPELRRDILGGRLLTEARHDEAVAEVIRQLELEEVCEALVHGLQESDSSREGLSRAIRNLTMVAAADRDEVTHAAYEALTNAGCSEDFAASVIDEVTPSRLRVRERARAQEEGPVERIVRLVDLAPMRSPGLEDRELEVLRREAAQGLTDGDVIAALIGIVSLERRPEPFATVMALLEDNLELLVDRGDYDVAAEAAAVFAHAAEDPGLSDGQRKRLVRALGSLAKPDTMRRVVSALRLYGTDAPEYVACVRLLDALGEHALGALVEILGKEQDMAARKTLVDLIARVSGDHPGLLRKHLADGRWYVVRNVVGVLAKIKRVEVLPYLQRTLRHPDERVRRETIRAIAGVRDALSDEMLVAALDDEDEQNVQLAARYLGLLGSRKALGALHQVARGEGGGSREAAARVEALEALGRISAAESLPVVEGVARSRAFGGRGREVRAAAEAASAAIRSALDARKEA